MFTKSNNCDANSNKERKPWISAGLIKSKKLEVARKNRHLMVQKFESTHQTQTVTCIKTDKTD